MKIKADYTNTPQWKTLNIKSTLPKQLEYLNELAHNMWWAWNYEDTTLFYFSIGWVTTAKKPLSRTRS